VTLRAGLQVVLYARTAILQRIMRATRTPGALGELRWDVLPLLPLALATAAVAVLAVLSGILTLREAYEAIDLPILVLLACLIPISDAVAGTGVAELIAGGLAAVAGALPPVGAVAPARARHGTDAVPHRLRRPIQCPPQHLSGPSAGSAAAGRFLPL
jgi:di/tricarboxylate transporter